MKIWVWILIIVAIGVIGYVVGRAGAKQVVDADGKAVKGKFLADATGATAVLQK